MRVTPRTEKEIAEMNLWQPGNYSFEIATAVDEVSKSQNEMIKLGLNVYNEKGESRIVFDYLLDIIPHKIRHLCEACGLLEKYEQGSLYAVDFVNKTGELKLIIQKDKTGQYADKNTVYDYIVKKGEIVKVVKTGNASFDAAFDDEVPFN